MKKRNAISLMAALVCFLAGTVVFTRCTEPPVAKEVQTLDSLSEYQIVTLKINEKEKSLKLRKDIHVSLPLFRNFVAAWTGRPLRFEQDTLMDVTGEGQLQQVHCSIAMHGEDCYVVHTVTAHTKYIWTDTLIIPNEYCNYLWGDDSSFVQLKPYSIFFVGMDFKEFISAYDKEFAEDKSNSVFETSCSKADSLYWVKELKEYNGKLVHKLDVMDYDTYIWDKRSGSFVLLHEP